jgi:cation diffusion facilitator CzcD-associated flavoprotein CzcO
MLSCDYLIKGAGAMGMAAADVLLAETGAELLIVDRHHRPGGHWNDAYPFVRLHQPSTTYGVNSRPLGSGNKDMVGLNRGLYELASGAEVLAYFDAVMHEQFLPSARVRWLPSHELLEDGRVRSLLSGRVMAVILVVKSFEVKCLYTMLYAF